MKYSSRKQWFKLSILICALSSISPLSFAADSSTPVSAKPAATAETTAQAAKNTGFIFVQSAKEATIEQIKDKPNTYKITLKNLHPRVTYISERPQRKTGSITHEQFIEEWNRNAKNSLSNNAPNAFLHGLENDKTTAKAMNIAVQLSQPALDTQNHSITYIINPLDVKENKLSTTTIHNVTLFIDDDVCLYCW